MKENMSHSVKVGDIFNMQWGYDQTQSEHFQVTRLTCKGVYVRQIGSKTVPGSEGFMCQMVVPDKDNFLSRSQWCGGFDDGNPETFRKIQFSNYDKNLPPQPYFNFKGRYFARPVKVGESTYNSWYA